MSRILKKYETPKIYEYTEKKEDSEWGSYCSSCGDKRYFWEIEKYGDRCALCTWDNVEYIDRFSILMQNELEKIRNVAVDIQRILQADLTRFVA